MKFTRTTSSLFRLALSLAFLGKEIATEDKLSKMSSAYAVYRFKRQNKILFE